jgi:hypothetical protein
MIEFYYRSSCPRCTAVRDALGELLIRHQNHDLGAKESLPGDIEPDTPMPVLIDGSTVFAGTASVLEHLEELAAFRKEWYDIQSNACSCTEERSGIASR